MTYHASIHTSDGEVHETDCVEKTMEIVDQYGPEVVSVDETATCTSCHKDFLRREGVHDYLCDSCEERELKEASKELLSIGTCQTCGRYHDYSRVKACPCGGEVL